MREYGFSLTRIFLYKDTIYDFVLIRENTGQWKPVFSHILCSGLLKTHCSLLNLVAFLIHSFCWFVASKKLLEVHTISLNGQWWTDKSIGSIKFIFFLDLDFYFIFSCIFEIMWFKMEKNSGKNIPYSFLWFKFKRSLIRCNAKCID